MTLSDGLTIGDGLACCAAAYVFVFLARISIRSLAAASFTRQMHKLIDHAADAFSKAAK